MSQRYPPGGITGRSGAGPVSKEIIPGEVSRDLICLAVGHESAKVWISFGPTAAVGEGVPITEADGIVHFETNSAISAATSTEGANEKQKITFSGAEAGAKVTFSHSGESAAALEYDAETTKEEVAEALEEIEALEGNIAVTGEAGGPFTVEFKEDLKAADVETISATATKVTVAIETTVPGGVSVTYTGA